MHHIYSAYKHRIACECVILVNVPFMHAFMHAFHTDNASSDNFRSGWMCRMTLQEDSSYFEWYCRSYSNRWVIQWKNLKFLRIFMEWNGIVWVIFVLYRLLFGTVLKCDVRFVIFILVIATSTVYTHSWFVSGRKEANPVTCGSIADAEIHPKSIMVTSLSINVAIGLKIEHSVPFLPFSHFTFVWMGGVLRAFPLVVLFWTLWRIANRTGTTEISLGMVLQFWFAARLNQY